MAQIYSIGINPMKTAVSCDNFPGVLCLRGENVCAQKLCWNWRMSRYVNLVNAVQLKKAGSVPERLRATSITSAAAAAAATVKMMDEEDEVLGMDGADLITSRLAQWGIAEDEEEEDTIVVDEDKVHSLQNRSTHHR